jgi:hypothetical protein
MRHSLSRNRNDLHALSINPALRARFAVAWRNVGPISPAGRALIAMTQQFTKFPSSC